MSPRADVVVVGGGIVGLASATKLTESHPGLEVTVLEAETSVGLHQSSHNSGVLHAGVYYAPGSAKAAMCRSGKEAMERFCAEADIPVHRLGKLVVAVAEGEMARFDELVHRATANGVPGLRRLGPQELREVEPHARGIAAIHSPSTGAVDFGLVSRALAARLTDVRTEHRVLGIAEVSGGVRVTTTGGDVEARVAVVCGGVQAERLAHMTGHRPSIRVVPFRGSWLELTPEGAGLVRGNIYPVPDPRLPFLGVHLTRRFDGAVWAGPNAVLSLRYPRLLARAAAHPGLARLAREHWKTAASEIWRDRLRSVALRGLQRYVPELGSQHLARGPKPYGVRAQAVDRRGRLVDDFIVEGSERVVHVLNAPSPAATSAFAIGDMVAAEVRRRTDAA